MPEEERRVASLYRMWQSKEQGKCSCELEENY